MDQVGIFFSLGSLVVLFSCYFTDLAGAEGVGINYGMLGNNLPHPEKVISLCKSRNIQKLRLFDPNPTALAALHNSGIQVILGTYNQDLPSLAGNLTSAADWVKTHVTPHAGAVRFRYISAGNEVVPGDLAAHVLPAMRNLESALKSAGIHVPVTTAVSTSVLGSSYPPSAGVFSGEASPVMTEIATFLSERGSPLLVNVYPYFAYAGDPKDVRLDYALFTAKGVVVWDGKLGYQNLFDAIVDAVYAAVERAIGAGAGERVEVVASETGWPAGGGGKAATVEGAKVYNNKAVEHAKSGKGTPRRPGKGVETYVFALFNENLKSAGIEQNFGIFLPDMSEVYHVNF